MNDTTNAAEPPVRVDDAFDQGLRGPKQISFQVQELAQLPQSRLRSNDAYEASTSVEQTFTSYPTSVND